jgi:hypothetical protein
MGEEDEEDESDALIGTQGWGDVSAQKKGGEELVEREERTASYDERGPTNCEGCL